jgi:hypothetical protein
MGPLQILTLEGGGMVANMRGEWGNSIYNAIRAARHTSAYVLVVANNKNRFAAEAEAVVGDL